MSSVGWMLIRLGRLGHDTGGGEITKISPTGELDATLPLLRWRDAAVVGITDGGVAVFRNGVALFVLGSNGESVPLLRLDELGVTSDLSNLADVALAADGRLAVLVGDGLGQTSYRLFVRSPRGKAERVMKIARAALFDTSPGDLHRPTIAPSVAFTGEDVVVAGDAGLMRFQDGRLHTRITVTPAQRGRLRPAPAAMVGLPHERWAIGRDPLTVLDGSGHVHRPGFGPCPTDENIRRGCPAMLAGLSLPRPGEILPTFAAGAVGAVLLALILAGRLARAEGRRIRVAATILATVWITTWLAASLVWGELHGSGPLLLLAGAVAAILSPAFPAAERRTVDNPGAVRHLQPWVSDRIAGQALVGTARRLEVTPLPSRS